MEPLPVLVVEDDADLREALEVTLTAHGVEVVTAASGPEALALLEHQPVAMVVSDLKMSPMDGLSLLAAIRQKLPHLPVAIMTAFGDVPTAVAAMRGGACEFLIKPFESSQLLALIRRYGQPGLVQGGMVAEDPATRQVVALAERVAATDATVLLQGESGVGKEVFARFIHEASGRAQGPFVAMNCAAIPESLLEATLFGYERGAFTGATAPQPGKFEQANGGTILLDEISEMPLSLQAKLLRVLQEREVERLGGKRPIAVDARVVATTNRDLAREVQEGRFRADLFYRLNVFPLTIPPLRARRGDIIPLARHFLGLYAREWGRAGATLTAEAETLLMRYGWPGNVRELSNVVQRALILSPGPVVTAETVRSCLPAVMVGEGEPPKERPAERQTIAPTLEGEAKGSLEGRDPLEREGAKGGEQKGRWEKGAGSSWRDRERERILRVLAEERGSRKRTAQRLGLPERTLRYRLQKYREAGFAIPGDEES
ncbi:MAG: sigma-54 dependent transcriptional regulator [Hydrogenophilus sp.]|nr:sigma-54 dependent transcriptional regulator [Hydrogenophilus sp.]